MAATKATERKTVARNSVVLEETVNNRWRAVVLAGTTVEDLKDPQFWATRASSFKVYDRIVAVTEDQAHWWELLVTDQEVGWAEVLVLQSVKLPPKSVTTGPRVPDGYKLDRGIEGYRVIRESDEHPLTRWCPRAEEAIRECLDHAAVRQPITGR